MTHRHPHMEPFQPLGKCFDCGQTNLAPTMLEPPPGHSPMAMPVPLLSNYELPIVTYICYCGAITDLVTNNWGSDIKMPEQESRPSLESMRWAV